SPEIRVIQNVDHIQPELEILGFMNLEPLDEIHVKIQNLRPSNRGVTECSKFTRLRIHEDVLAIRASNRPIRVPRAKTIAGRRRCDAVGRNTGKAWVSVLLESIEVDDSVGHFCYFAHVSRKHSYDVWRSGSGLPASADRIDVRRS